MKIGGIDITALNLGTTPVQEVSRGEVKIWPDLIAPPDSPVLSFVAKGHDRVSVSWTRVDTADRYLTYKRVSGAT